MPARDVPVRGALSIPAREIVEVASRSGGPGGQHVNKTSTRVTLRWNVAESQALSEAQRRRIADRLGHRLTRTGTLVVHADRHRVRSRNRELARERMAELVREALATRRPRRATRPSRGVKARGVEAKRRRGALKRDRSGVRDVD